MPPPPEPERTFLQLHGFLEARSGRKIEMQLNSNRVSYVTFEELAPGGRVRLRLQSAFLSAPGDVLTALARWIGTCRGRCPRAVHDFVESRAAREAAPRKPVRTRARGRHHHLGEIMADVNRECFRGRLRLRITWGRRVDPRRHVSRRQLGSYDRAGRLITISRVLDREEVPRFFVAYVVFHEMLHAVQRSGAGRDHDEEFRRVERMHPDFRRAAAWQRGNLPMLMHPGGTARRRPTRAAKTVRDTRGEQGLLF